MTKKILSAFLVLCFSLSSLFCDTSSSTDYDDINFPQWSKDLRRTEIITFGSLPFVTLWTSLGYGFAVQGKFHNPLDKSTSGYTESQQKQIIAIAAGTSLALGLTDLAVNLITRKIRKNRQQKIEKTIRVVPLSQLEKENQDDKIPAEPPHSPSQEIDADFPLTNPPSKDYLIRGMENAIF